MTLAATSADSADVEFPTSGHTADPVVWVRTADQLRVEVELIAETVLGPIDHVVTFAPRTHLYGHLFGHVLPSVLGVGVVDLSGDPLAMPEAPGGRRLLYVCLPSSWPLLRALAVDEVDLTGSVALHSTGPVTATATRALPALLARGLRAVELFGSTETGGIAQRPMSGGTSEPWLLLPDVALVDDAAPDGTCLLHVRSPRIARRRDGVASGTHRLSDVVQPLGHGRFAFLGRSSRLVKINGRRCDLADIEEAVGAALPGVDVACVGVPDQLRGEHYELFCAGGPGEPSRWLPAALGGLPAPRAVHRVERIPRTLTGKVKVDRLFALTLSGVSAR